MKVKNGHGILWKREVIESEVNEAQLPLFVGLYLFAGYPVIDFF